MVVTGAAPLLFTFLALAAASFDIRAHSHFFPLQNGKKDVEKNLGSFVKQKRQPCQLMQYSRILGFEEKGGELRRQVECPIKR
jgi:hypothetical protein